MVGLAVVEFCFIESFKYILLTNSYFVILVVDSMTSSKNHAVVIVLGDSGRSPRMQFHASSLASLSEVSRVSLIGYSGEACNETVTGDPKIRDCRLDASTFKSIEFLRIYSSLVHAVFKGILLVLSLIRLLFSVAGKYTDTNGNLQESIPISFIIIQNPPAIPVVLATLLYRILVYILAICTFSNPVHQAFTICIDWHNLGFTLYYDKYKPTHLLVRISYHLEHLMAKVSDLNFCVSAAMRKWLLLNYGIASTVFYDRPPKSVFQKFNSPINDAPDKVGDHDGSTDMRNTVGDEDYMSIGCVPLDVRHELLLKLNLTDDFLFPSLTHCMHSTTDSANHEHEQDMDTVMTEVTVQTFRHRDTGAVCARQDRAVLLLSSTSWTPDEDFRLLTKALINLDKSIAKRRGSESPRKKRDHSRHLLDQRVSNVATRVVVVITGKGPMKEQFMAEWKESQQPGSPTKLRYISLITVWLETGDYPLMVGCADMGICLHTSSSGVDLPMKVRLYQ